MSNFYKTYPPLFSNTVIVTSWQDLQQLEDKTTYYIDGEIDMLGNAINLPPNNGISQIIGFSANIVTILNTTENYTMFLGGGQLFINGIKITVSGANSKVFGNTSASPFNAIELINVNFEGCTSLGYLDGYRQALFDNIAIFGCSNGLGFRGTWAGGCRISTSIVRTFSSLAGAKIFYQDGDLVFNSRFLSDANIVVDGNSVAYSFEEGNFANDGLYQLIGGQIAGTSTAKYEGVDNTSTKSIWQTNGLPETVIGGKWTITTPSATIITDTGAANAVKMAGVTTSSNLVWVSSPVSNRLQWDSQYSGKLTINGSLSFTAGNNQQIGVVIKKYDASATAFVDINTFTITTNGAGKAENVALVETVELDTGDYIEIFLFNDTAIANITASASGVFFIEGRKTI